jgi:hypothetical protein
MPPCVVDEHVDPPGLLDGGVRRLSHILLLRHVSCNRDGSATSPADLRHVRLDPRGAACRNDDARALGRQIAGSGFAPTAGLRRVRHATKLLQLGRRENTLGGLQNVPNLKVRSVFPLAWFVNVRLVD